MFQDRADKTMIKLANLTLRSARASRWNFGSVRQLKGNAVSSIVFHEANTTLDQLNEIQKVLVNGLLQEPFFVATAFGNKNDLLQLFTKEWLEDRFQEGLSIVARQDQRIVGVGLGRTLASVDDSEVFPHTAAAMAFKSLRSHLMRQTCPAKETGVLLQSITFIESYRGSSLYDSFREEWLDLIRAKGFKTVYVISRTDHATKRLLKSSNFEAVERISYDKFVFSGTKPFKSRASQLGGATILVKIL